MTDSSFQGPDTDPRRLLISFPNAFILGWLGSTSRISDLASGLAELGWRSDLLTSKPLGGAEPLECEESFPGRVIRIPFHMGPWPLWLDFKGIRRLWLLACRLLGRGNLLDDPERVWPVRLRRWQKSLRQSCGRTPDLVWGVCTGYIDGLVAARTLSDLFNCPFVAEFQDPPRSARCPGEERALSACISSCAKVVTTTRALAEHLEEAFPVCRGKISTVYLSYEEVCPADTTDGRQDDALTILHAGRLHGRDERNARMLVQGLASAAQARPESKGQIRLHLLGEGSGIDEACRLAKGLGIGECVKGSPPVSRAEAYKAMRDADVLAVIKCNSPSWNMQIPGKLFSYLPFCKPILGIMGECEAAEILRRTGLGVIVPHGDADRMARALLDLWCNRHSLGQHFKPVREYVSQFNRREMARMVNRMLRGILSGDSG